VLGSRLGMWLGAAKQLRIHTEFSYGNLLENVHLDGLNEVEG
jgi:hypothetical protein